MILVRAYLVIPVVLLMMMTEGGREILEQLKYAEN
jgi:hypothetical protein